MSKHSVDPQVKGAYAKKTLHLSVYTWSPGDFIKMQIQSVWVGPENFSFLTYPG